ncbi:sulfite exporter TauE/SafE family protein [Paractinoplanes rishiriensis]|uniref:Probable membrane transporter protein n=1 Tax=Paractinoplanes rishiriensis TaxID=1050105 RepID=A0A919K588_9ACTN|nr:sulfite exporter TauE/SafE family protein [Actinoplanes rishiriensis]GIF01147.1 UPF0721 transmembrane protein [Actinoplanes rishiriensis]
MLDPATIGDLAIAAVVAVVAGGVNSIAGGGSLVLFPTLIGLGLPTVSANVTNAVVQWPGYLGGVFGFRRQLISQRRRVAMMSVVALAGGAGGSVLLLTTPSAAFNEVVPVLVLLSSALLAVQPRLARLRTERAGKDAGARRSRDPVWLYLGVLLATVYGGYFGGALGVILIAVLGVGVGDVPVANAIKTALSLVTATVAAAIFGIFGPVSWPYFAVCAPASLVGGVIGARIAVRLPVVPLRIFIVVFGVAVAAYLFWRL